MSTTDSDIKERAADAAPGAQPSSARRKPPASEVETFAALIDKLEDLQVLQAELLGKAQAWNRVALISETDRDGVILSVNENFVRHSGYTRDELVGQKHSVVKSGHQHEYVFEEMWKTLLGGKVWKGYLKNKTLKGDFFWVYSTIFPILDDSRTPVRFYSVAVPVSDLIEPAEETKLHLVPAFALTPDSQARQMQQLRQQLQTIKAEHEHALQSVHRAVMIAETDARGIITAVNDHFVEVTGYQKHELIGQNHRLLKSPEQSSTAYDTLWQTITQGLAWRGLLVNRRKDGTDYRVEIQITPELDEDGKPRRFLAISWMLSDTVEAAFAEQANLRKLKSDFQQLQQQLDNSQTLVGELESMQQLLFSQVSALNSAAFVLETDADGRLSFVNEAFIRYTGFMRESLFGQPLVILRDDETATGADALARSIEERKSWRGQLKIRSEVGASFWVEMALHPADNPETGAFEKFVVILFNIDGWKRKTEELEAELSLLRGQEQELQRNITDLFYKNNSLQKLQNEFEHRNTGIDQAFPILETDPSGIILFVNDTFCRQYAARPEDWMGRGLDTWLSTRIPSEEAEAWLLSARPGSETPLLLPPQDVDFRRQPFALHICPIHDADGNWVKQLHLMIPAVEAPTDATDDPRVLELVDELEQTRQRSGKLEAEFNDLKQTLANLNTENEVQQRRLEEHDAAKSAWEAELNAKQSEIDSLKSQAEEIARQPTGVSEDTFRASEMARRTLEQRIQALVRDKEATQANFLKAQQARQDAAEQVQRLQAEYDQEKQWANELQERYAQLEKDLRQAEADKENQAGQFSQLERRYAELESINEEFGQNVQELRNHIRDLESQLGQHRQGQNEHQQNLSILVQELENARKLHEESRKSKELLADELHDARRLYEEAQRNRTQQAEEMSFVQRQYAELRSRFQQQELDLRQKEAADALLSQRNETLSLELEQLRSEMEKAGDHAQQLTFENERLSARLRDMERRMVELESRPAAAPTSVPTQQAVEDDLRQWAGFAPPVAPPPAPKRLLFVEADFSRLETVSGWLKEMGFDFKVSARGDEALDVYAEFKPDVLVADLRLPGLNGFELTDVLRNDYEDKSLSILAITPVELLPHRAEYLKSGFTEIIGKPYSRESLEEALRKVGALR